jgi:hypothetical protein
MENLDKKYFKVFETFVTKKLNEHDIRLDRVEDKLNLIDERTAYLPKLYDAVDAFMKEILESREDKVFLGHRVDDHEKRILVLEN